MRRVPHGHAVALDHLRSRKRTDTDPRGEPSALAVIDATVRLLPGAMSDLDSARTDSFFDRELSAPSYTRPPVFRVKTMPAPSGVQTIADAGVPGG